MTLLKPPTQFIRIDRARCKGCGDKRALKIRGREYDLPIIVDMRAAERTPWRCGDCRGKIDLDVVMVE